MKFGLSTLTRGVFSTRENYRAVAVAAERTGFDFLSVSDHVVVPANLQSRYPYAASGVFSAAEYGRPDWIRDVMRSHIRVPCIPPGVCRPSWRAPAQGHRCSRR